MANKYCMHCGTANDAAHLNCKKCKASFASAAPVAKPAPQIIVVNPPYHQPEPEQHLEVYPPHTKSVDEILARLQPIGDDEIDTTNPNSFRLSEIIKDPKE